MGNLHSVAKALQAQGAHVRVSASAAQLNDADVLVMPGVGSFGAAMETLRQKNLDTFVQEWIQSGRPYFGICLGLQLLFESSDESPGIPGLGILPGKVVKFKGVKHIPHMGWNTVKASAKNAVYFKGIKTDDRFYFVHSYYAAPQNKSDVAVTTTYGKAFCSGVSRDNLFAVQFHPEKSGQVGQRLLKNILSNVKAGVAA
jgi:imidazole glycerol phosphate synthase glutamine amidotransferase subunit